MSMRAGWLAMVLALAACAPASELRLKPVSFASLEHWSADQHAEALVAFQRSCERSAPAGDAWQRVCAVALRTAPVDARTFFEAEFMPYRAEGEGLLTGYYEPVLEASLTPRADYPVPLYAPPAYVTRFSRAEIDAGALAGQGLEVAWARDAVDVFFTQVQGSARLLLPSGQTRCLAFAAKNGKPYTAIGKVLATRGVMPAEDINLFSLKAWLRAHPKEGAALMRENASYVFFRVEPGSSDGPRGASGVALTPLRSLAVDPAHTAYGTPVFVQTAEWQRLMIAQDTGSAIRGPLRGDAFFGAGAEAEARAGHLKAPVRWVVLLPREQAP